MYMNRRKRVFCMVEYLFINYIFFQAEVDSMSVNELRHLCLSMVERHPAVVFDILRPQQQQPGGYHPPPGANVPDWCTCQKCREIPTQIEKQCCGKEHCISLLPVSVTSITQYLAFFNLIYFRVTGIL